MDVVVGNALDIAQVHGQHRLGTVQLRNSRLFSPPIAQFRFLSDNIWAKLCNFHLSDEPQYVLQ